MYNFQCSMYNKNMETTDTVKKNVIQDKSYAFALRVVRMYQYLVKTKKEKILATQVLRSGTSIGANVEEAIGSYSGREFHSKLSIAYKEARETKYWLRLLRDAEYIEFKATESLLLDCEEVLKILGKIISTTKRKN